MYFEYRSSCLKTLVKKLAQELDSSRPDSPFQKELIVVQNKETQQWLTLQLANELNILANVDFVLPSEFMWKLYRSINQHIPKHLPSDRIPIQWEIMDEFNKHRSLYEQIGLNIPETLNGKISLAHQVSDVFDLYQIYRPDLLKNWELSRSLYSDDSENWQRTLWQNLSASWKSKFSFPAHKGIVFEELVEYIKQNVLQNDVVPKRCVIFGLSQWSQPFASLVATISTQKEILHYIHHPKFNKDERYSNLFADWLTPKNNSIDLLTKHFDEINSTNLNLESQLPKINVNSSHSIKREVEVLKHTLLDYFQSDESLNMEEVLIMVPDLMSYGHHLKSIFEFDLNEPAIPIQLPFNEQNEHEFILIKLLELVDSTFKITDLFDVLTLPPIASAFNLSQTDIHRIGRWFADTNTHFGLTKDESNFSIEKSIDSLFLGLTVELDDFESAYGLSPHKGLDAAEDVHLVAKLSKFVSLINRFALRNKEQYLSIRQWLYTIDNWCSEFFSLSNELSLLFDKLLSHIEYVSDEQLISFTVFKKWLITHLLNQNASSNGLTNGIVVSTYIPYRNIPFKIKVMLGFDEQSFPRKPFRPPFDLISKFPKKGDRITKQDDQLLFLETIQSTEDLLFISYVGEHQKKPKRPSVLVQQLLDLSENSIAFAKHKLHRFDTHYLKEEINYSSYVQTLYKNIHNPEKNRKFWNSETELSNVESIQLNDLINFFISPAKYYAEQILGVRSPYEQKELEDREQFKLDGISKFELNKIIQNGILNDVSKEEIFEHLVRSGYISDSKTSMLQFESFFSSTQEFVNVLNAEINTPEESLSFNIENNAVIVECAIDRVFDQNLIMWRNGQSRAKDLISWWISHLAIQHSPLNKQSKFIRNTKDESVEVMHLSAVSNASNILAELVRLYSSNFTKKLPLAWFPEVSFAFAEAKLAGKDGILAARKIWEGNDFSKGKGQDYYNQLVWRDIDAISTKEFGELALMIWEPFKSHLNVTTNG